MKGNLYLYLALLLSAPFVFGAPSGGNDFERDSAGAADTAGQDVDERIKRVSDDAILLSKRMQKVLDVDLDTITGKTLRNQSGEAAEFENIPYIPYTIQGDIFNGMKIEGELRQRLSAYYEGTGSYEELKTLTDLGDLAIERYRGGSPRIAVAHGSTQHGGNLEPVKFWGVYTIGTSELLLVVEYAKGDIKRIELDRWMYVSPDIGWRRVCNGSYSGDSRLEGAPMPVVRLIPARPK